MDLDHRGPDCAGEWHQESGQRWRCMGCGKAYFAAPEVGMGARMENEIGRLMMVLAAIGQQQMDAEGPRNRDPDT